MSGRAGTLLDVFATHAARTPDAVAIRYRGRSFTFAELDRMSDALAAALQDSGFRPHDRGALFLQNVPQYVLALLGIWKAGGIAVSVNPMSRARELTEILQDSGATLLVALDTLHADVAAEVVATVPVPLVLTTGAAAVPGSSPDGATDLLELVRGSDGRRPGPVVVRPDDPACLTYTSGTTGPPKGAITTHANAVFNARTYRDWIGLGAHDPILGVAPLFHITGLIAHIALGFVTGSPLLLDFRFDPGAVVALIEQERPAFTIGSITVFIALMEHPAATREGLASLRAVYSGGAPIAPATLTMFRERFGLYIHNIYGLTETTSPVLAVPFGTEAPVDEEHGAVSVGVPVPHTRVRVVDERGVEVEPGQLGEIVCAGPQVVPGYWQRPQETRAAIVDGELRTGDIGFRDPDGWFYVVDRKKDQINAGGYKIWPREVESVLAEHPAVREAAVVGVPDAYRGETVKAVVSCRRGTEVTADALIAFTRERLAAYKVPRIVEIVDELPKTTSGKVLRRALRPG